MSETVTVWMADDDAQQYLLYKSFKKGCDGKSAYKSQARALTALSSVLRRNALAKVKGAVAYKCQFCGFWHLGHNKRARQ